MTPSAYRRWSVAAVSTLGGFAIYLYAHVCHRLARGHISDFRPFYRGARALITGQNPYYIPPEGRPYIYPPLIAFLYAPLATLPDVWAAQLLLPLLLLALAAALIIGAREILRRLACPTDLLAVCTCALLAGAIMADKSKSELQMMQTNSLILLAFVLALRWMDRRPAWAGLVLGAAANIKYLPLLLVPWLLLRRRWSVAGWVLLGAVGFALLPAVLVGWGTNLAYLKVALAGVLRLAGIEVVGAAGIQSVDVGFSVSVTSALARLLSNRLGYEAPLTIVLAAAAPIAAAVLLAAVGIYRRYGVPLLRWPAASEQTRQPFAAVVAIEYISLIALIVCFSPQTNTRHLLLALPLATLAAAVLLNPRPASHWSVLLVGLTILFAGLTLPPGNQDDPDYHAARLWVQYGGQCWSMLVAMVLILAGGIRYAAAPPAIGGPLT